MGTRIPLNLPHLQAQDRQRKLELSTAEIGLSVRTTNCLEERGIFTVRDLLYCTPEYLLSIANFGEKTLEEVYQALERLGFYRKSKRLAMQQAQRQQNETDVQPTTGGENRLM